MRYVIYRVGSRQLAVKAVATNCRLQINKMLLSNKQIKFLRAKCHDLNPVILMGQKGLTEEVLNELNIALDYHELVKIKLAVDDREVRKQLIANICEKTQSEEIQSIGKTLSVYRMNIEKPVIELPKR